MPSDSTKPKGATSYKETALGIIPHSQLLQLELEGTKKGLEYLYFLIKGNKAIEITPELIKELHKVSFQWIFPEWAGKFRTIQVTYSDKEAPQYFLVPELVQNLCSDLQLRLKNLSKAFDDHFIDSVIELLAWFQHQFVFIHPFQDYNGRMGRMLTVLIQLKLNLPAAEIQISTESDRKKYLLAMQKGDEGDLSVLEELIAETLKEALQTGDR